MAQRIGVGIIGTGQYARGHIELMAGIPEFSVVALCNPRPGQIQATWDEFPDLETCAVYSDHLELLADPSVDAVLIASPHTFHAVQVVDSFTAGKHVLVEKPLACTRADALRAIAARDAAGKVGAIGYQRRGVASYKFVRESIASGRYGRILALNSHFARPWMQYGQGTWRQTLALSGGGQINDGGSHLIDLILWMSGLRAKRVSAMMDNRGTEVDIDSILSIEFNDRALGSLTIVGDSPVWHDRHQVWLEKGAFLIEGNDLTVIDGDGRVTQVSDWPVPVSPIKNFAAALVSGDEVLAPFEAGLRTIELTESAWQSAASGGTPVDVISVESDE